VALLVGSFQEASYVNTLPDDVLSGGCFTSYRVVWQLGIVFSFSMDHLMEHQVMMELLEEKQYLGREYLSCTHFWVPLFYIRRDLCGLSVEKKE
jgi:hypothetical protein